MMLSFLTPLCGKHEEKKWSFRCGGVAKVDFVFQYSVRSTLFFVLLMQREKHKLPFLTPLCGINAGKKEAVLL